MAMSWTQDIWFVVRVPVLSEQMTVVQPKVSTEGSFLQTSYVCKAAMQLILWSSVLTRCRYGACSQ